MRSFSGKTVFVTGGGSGIGKEIALAFAREGADVLLNDLPNQQSVFAVKSEIESMGRTCTLKLGDVSSAHAVKEMFKCTDRLDVLVNNAGYLREASLAEWKRKLLLLSFSLRLMPPVS